MKIQKVMKLTLEIIFIVFFSFSFQVNETKARDMKAKMDISEFTYGLTSFTHSNINPIVVTSSDTSGNYDPRFNLAGISPLPDSADHEETLMQQGKDKVFPYINGSTFYKIALLEKMTLWGDASAKQFAQTIINLSKQYTWESEDQRLNSYFLFPTNYQQFLTEKTKNGSLVPASENPLYFFPGISYQAPLTEKVFPDNVITTIRNALKIQENSSNKFYFSIDAVKQLENVSFGACYKINPPGKTNACFNTSKQNCLAYAKNTNVTDDGNTWNEEWINEIAGTNLISLSEMEKKNIYFLHGISCEKVDVLMNNPSSRTGTKTATTEKAQYYMLLYFHGYLQSGDGNPDDPKITDEEAQNRFEQKVFSNADMQSLRNSYITVWVNEPAKAFNNTSSWGDVPFNEIINKSFEYCKNNDNKGSGSWDKTKKINIDSSFTATINCGYNPTTKNVNISEVKTIAAGHSAAGRVMNQSIASDKIYHSVLLDALYYAPVSAVQTCTKWTAIQASMSQSQLSAWKQYCPNNVTQGTTTVHADIMKDLPAFLKKKFATSITSVQEQQPTEQIAAAALKEKTIFKPQISFAGITEGISLPDYMNLMYKYLMSFALVVTGFVIVIGGVKYMIGQNDGIPMIKNAFIGVLLLSGTYVILKTVSPGTVNMNIIEINDISRKTTTNNNVAQTGLGTVLTNAVATAAGDRSPSPAIEIGTGWYFPVSIEDVDVKNFKYNATSKSAGGSFGYWRRTNKYALEHTPDYPVVCHHAVDIYTNKPGKVVAITDGVIVASGNSFANCSGGQTGSLIIQHKDKNGNTFIARYGEVDIVDTAKHKPGATVKAGESLGNATRCGMLHFELHAKGNVLAPKWRMPASLLTDMLSDYKTPQSIKDLYQVQGNTITNIEKFENESALKGKNCLDSPTALNYLVQDKANNGQYLLNPSSFLINLWNKTGDINKQITE